MSRLGISKKVLVVCLICLGLGLYVFKVWFRTGRTGYRCKIISAIPWGNQEDNLGLGKTKYGEALGPANVTIAKDGAIYISDPVNGKALVLGLNTNKIKSLDFLKDKIRPVRVLPGPLDKFYVLDANSRRLYYGKPGEMQMLSENMPPKDFATGDIYYVEDFSSDSKNNLYLMDSWWMVQYSIQRLIRISPDGAEKVLYSKVLERSGAIRQETAGQEGMYAGRLGGFAISPRGGVYVYIESAESIPSLIATLDSVGRVTSSLELESDPLQVQLAGADEDDNLYIYKKRTNTIGVLEKRSRKGRLISEVDLTTLATASMRRDLTMSLAVSTKGLVCVLVPEVDGAKVLIVDAKFPHFRTSQ